MRDIKSRHHVSGADIQATPLDTRVRQLPVSKHVMSTTNNYYCTTATAIRNTGRRHANDAVNYTDVLRGKATWHPNKSMSGRRQHRLRVSETSTHCATTTTLAATTIRIDRPSKRAARRPGKPTWSEQVPPDERSTNYQDSSPARYTRQPRQSTSEPPPGPRPRVSRLRIHP